MRSGACGSALLLLHGVVVLLLQTPALAAGLTAGFTCPRAAMTNTTCRCTSGCAINNDFSFLWSPPVYPPASVQQGKDTICGVITLPCNPATRDLTAYVGANGYVRGTKVTGFHFFQGCAPGALVTVYTGFTAQECELLRIRYASLMSSDPLTAYPLPQLCTTNDCNADAGVKLLGGVTVAGTGTSSSAARARGTGIVMAAATALAMLA